MPGRLVVVSTPIGNLGDLSPRAVEALRAADVIACEDTRHTRKLLAAANITASKLIAVHDHNEPRQVRTVIDLLERGDVVALVTDAGTPAIADPGARIVAGVAARGLRVEVVPGPSALIAALVVSGLSTNRFAFEGFLPRKGGDRSRRLQAIADADHTTVFYEAPHRIERTVADLAEACGPLRRVALARELTKLYEDVWRGTLGAAVEHLAEVPPRGEFVVVVDAAPPPVVVTDDVIVQALSTRIDEGSDRREAITAVAAQLGVQKRRVYELAVRLRSGDT